MSTEQLRIPSPLEGVKFATVNLQPPSNVFTGPDDALFITTYGSANSVRIDVRARFLRADGIIIPKEMSNVPLTDRSAVTVVESLGEGWLLNASVFQGSGNAKRGQCYVVVGIARGTGAARFVHTILMQGYVGTGLNRAWPGDRLEQPMEGPGYLRGIPGTDPAPGAEISEVVPTGARWRLMSIGATLVTDATVQNRAPKLVIDIGSGSPFWTSITAGAQAASNTYSYFYGAGMSFDSLNGNQTFIQGIPNNLYMSAAWRFKTSTVLLQAGDNWGAPLYFVEEWIEP